MNTSSLYDIYLQYPHICTDSRKATEDSIFFALKGDNNDGNKYAEQALQKCPYAIVDNPDVVKNDRFILVDDVLETLQRLATYHRKRLGLPIIAITGTNGKTTTKELVAKVLSKKFNVCYTQGNLNNHIGVPLTLLTMTKEHTFGVVEMGASHPGEIAKLCKIAAPDFGIITNVGRAHLEGFGSFNAIKDTKAELYRYLHDNDGLAFVNYDNETLEDMNPPHSVVYYGTKTFTHCQGRITDNKLFLAIDWAPSDEIITDEIGVKNNSDYHIQTHLIGSYNFENVLAAVCVGNNFGISAADIKSAIEDYSPSNSRSQLIKTSKGNIVLADDYNANPSSMEAAITNFGQIELPNKTLVLGDMLELGSASTREHAVVVGLIEKLGFKNVYLVGSNYSNVSDAHKYNCFSNVEELIKQLESSNIKNASILVKGSHGMHMEKVIPVL
ncbi:MAG: UDP-N-acetylmuramoyl-tripeptide--D-alanyl-D-alanine ligase [Salinivirgaceae bacterium]|nr:UDP-N-acetylmuramoyl-tripeptide--D-alanyl-D-alanine ligase [Salinivirgaceae bacterium]